MTCLAFFLKTNVVTKFSHKKQYYEKKAISALQSYPLTSPRRRVDIAATSGTDPGSNPARV
jgi:hypothetical protein